MTMTLTTSLILISILALSFGVLYAVLIYHRPFPHGWTWVSVVIGDAMTDIFAGLGIIAVLYAVGLANDYWFIALLPVVAHLLTGVPMITGQAIKYVIEKTQTNNHKSRFGK